MASVTIYLWMTLNLYFQSVCLAYLSPDNSAWMCLRFLKLVTAQTAIFLICLPNRLGPVFSISMNGITLFCCWSQKPGHHSWFFCHYYLMSHQALSVLPPKYVKFGHFSLHSATISSLRHHHLLSRLLIQILNWFLCFSFLAFPIHSPYCGHSGLSEMKSDLATSLLKS